MVAGALACAAAGGMPAEAQSAEGVIFYQGRIAVGGSGYNGIGSFKFALVDAAGTQTFWQNSADANTDGIPDDAVAVSVSRGLYGVQLGDASIANMAAIPLSVFQERLAAAEGGLNLRVWFDDGEHGWQQLQPDQPIVPVAFALTAKHAQEASTVPDGSITSEKLAGASVTPDKISGQLLPAQIPDLDAGIITSGELDAARLPSALGEQIAALEAEVETLRARVGTIGEAPAGVVASSTDAADATLLGAGFSRFGSLPAGGWAVISGESGLAARSGHAAVWADGAGEMLVWGGEVATGVYSGVGALFNTASGTWRTVPSHPALSARRGHTIVWDAVNGEALAWGGYSGAGYLGDGARFDLAAFNWVPMSTTGAPAGRDGHIAIMAGPKMLVWGGRNFSGKLGDGFLYDPGSDAWTAVALAEGPAARSGATAVWTGDRVIIWGGDGAGGAVNTGAQLQFTGAPDWTPSLWQALPPEGAPTARTGHSAIWTGSRMIVWGGRGGDAFFNDGASYDPASDAWTALPIAGAPAARANHVAIWTGEEMVVHGGETAAGATATGAAYHPGLNRWRALEDGDGVALARSGATAVWAGTEMIVFGGRSGGTLLASPQRLDPQPAWHLYRKM